MSLAPVDLLDTLATEWGAMRMDTLTYIAAAEPLARSAAGSGDHLDVKRLAIILSVKGSGMREHGREGEAIAAEVECIKTLDSLADAGDDNALQLLAVLSRSVSPYALGAAAGQRLFEAAPAGPPPAAPLDSPPPAARRERLRWWCEDRRDDARWWFADLKWSVRVRWWAVVDRLRFGRKGDW